MSSEPGDQYSWRETYFVWFESKRRPTLAQVEEMVRTLPGHFELDAGEADAEGRIESLRIRSHQDHAAVEIDYLFGDEVRAEGATLASEFKPSDGVDPAKLARLRTCDARFDIMHFEEMLSEPEDDELDEMFDPSALLVVLEGLTRLTGGVGVDPQSGLLL
jgi:hypothetical protein